VHLVLPSKARRCCGAQVEFNKAALSLSDAIPTEQRKAALNRLLKVRRSRVSMALSACCASRGWQGTLRRCLQSAAHARSRAWLAEVHACKQRAQSSGGSLDGRPRLGNNDAGLSHRRVCARWCSLGQHDELPPCTAAAEPA